MWKGIFGTVIGLAVSLVVVMIIQKVGQSFYPTPPGLDMKNKEAMGLWIRQMPVGAFLWLLAGYALGSFAGGAAAALVGKSAWPALATGAVLTLMGITNVILIPHPTWFVVVSISLYLPFAWLAAILVLRR
jgi:hypothetical protein